MCSWMYQSAACLPKSEPLKVLRFDGILIFLFTFEHSAHVSYDYVR